MHEPNYTMFHETITNELREEDHFYSDYEDFPETYKQILHELIGVTFFHYFLFLCMRDRMSNGAMYKI